MIFDSFAQFGPGIANHHARILRPLEDTTTVDGLLASMDRAGIDRTVAVSPRWVGGEFVDPTYMQSNRKVHEAVQQYPDRLIGYARINPNYGADAVQELESCLGELGFKGVMLDPEWENFHPADQELVYPLLETARSFGVPVLFHSGYSPAEPALFWQPANDFPDLPIILGHMGGRLTVDAVLLAERAPNIYLETSDHMYRLATMAKRIGVERVLFGSNTPFSSPEVEAFKITVRKDLSKEQKDLILGVNALRLHGLA